MKKLFLLDAFALIYRAHFAFSKNPRYTAGGLNTSAVMGFTNTLLEVLKKEKPSHMAVVFDTSAPTERHVEFEAYKAHREAMPEDLRPQMPLTREATIAFNADGLPNTFVPGRNIIFLSFAATIAYRRGIKHIVAGMCETDYSGYPDCRDDTIKALQVALNLGMDRRFVLETPLMWLDKAATWRLAENLGGASLVEALLEHTHSCYLGDRRHRHAWGYGCGTCPACDLRAKGWAAYAAAETP